MENQDYRFYIKTRAILGVKAREIHEELTEAYGPKAISYTTVQRWTKAFNEGEMELEDHDRSGRPVTKMTLDNIQLVQRLIDEDPHCTYEDLEEETQLSRGTIERIVHDHLQMRKVTSRWVPHELTIENKETRVKKCRQNLAKINSGEWRLCDILTGDETWIYLRQLGRKAANSSWVYKGQSPGTVVRREQYEPKVLYSLFFRSNGGVFVHALDKGQKLDRYYYIENCLRPVIKEMRQERPKSGTHGLKLLHDNAKPHSAKEVKDYLKQEGINLVPHPPYSPDLSPSDFWLIDYIKRNLEDQTSEKRLFDAVTNLVFSTPKEEYKKAFERWIHRMELCIKNEGEYFEHLIE